MIYLSPNSTNTIVVTWTQRASTGDRYILRLTNIAKNATTDFTLLKSANLSQYTERYDKFQITLGSVETGSYRYEVTVARACPLRPSDDDGVGRIGG